MDTELFKKYDKTVNHFMDPKDIAKTIVYISSLPSNIAPTEIVLQRFEMQRT